MSKETLMDKINRWRRERTLSHERGFKPEPLDPTLVEEIPKDQEIVLFDPELCYPKEPVETHYPSWFPREAHLPPDMGKEIMFPNPMTAGDQLSYLQRKQMKRIPRSGKR